MTDLIDNSAPDIVEIAPVNDGLNSMQGEGVQPEAVEEKTDVKAEKPSLDETLKKAFKDSEEKAKEKADKPELKPKDEAIAPKTKDKPVVEPAAEKPVADEKVRSESKPSEGKRFESAPSRMLPEASQRWANVPNEVKAEVYRAFDDFEREKETLQEHVKFREELKEYEDLGKQHGVSVKQALDNYVNIERKFSESPSDGFKQLLGNLQMQPQQAISHILSAFNVSPQALAQHMHQQPEMYTAPQRAQQSQQQQPQQSNPLEHKIAQLEQRLNQKEQEQAVSAVVPVITNFATDHPDYYALESKIAEILKSGIIDTIHGDSLPVDKKLSEAYRMAGGQGSSSRFDQQDDNQQHSRAEKRPVNPDAGKLSIGGSSGGGDFKSNSKKKPHASIDDALKNAMRRAL